jgi:hypothetical protein
MMSECGEILQGLVRLQAAGMMAAGTAAARGVEMTLRQGEAMATTVVKTMVEPASPQRDTWDDAIRKVYEGQIIYLRNVVGLPRLTLMLFLGELHRLRTPFTDE